MIIRDFVDPQGKERKGRYFRIVTHESTPQVEVEIVGRLSNWLQWYDLKEFEAANPSLKFKQG